MSLKRLPILFLVLLVTALFFLNTWQGFRYETLRRQVMRLEVEQKDWLEKNKKLIAALAVFSSPERIEGLAKARLRLKRIDSSNILKVVLKKNGEFKQ